MGMTVVVRVAMAVLVAVGRAVAVAVAVGGADVRMLGRVVHAL